MSKVLVIDDDAIILRAIGNILKKDGYEVITAKDGREGISKLDVDEYDAVVTDLMMPHANGLEVVAKLRSIKGKDHIGIIVCSSVGNEETISEAYRLGANGYMKKPVKASELLSNISQLIAAGAN